MASPAPARDAAPDVARLRVELADLRSNAVIAPVNATPANMEPNAAVPLFPVRDATQDSDGEPTLAVLRAGLRSQRPATVELRGVIDDLRLALAREADSIEMMARERDAWAERVRILAAALLEAAALAAPEMPGAAKTAA